MTPAAHRLSLNCFVSRVVVRIPANGGQPVVTRNGVSQPLPSGMSLNDLGISLDGPFGSQGIGGGAFGASGGAFVPQGGAFGAQGGAFGSQGGVFGAQGGTFGAPGFGGVINTQGKGVVELANNLPHAFSYNTHYMLNNCMPFIHLVYT